VKSADGLIFLQQTFQFYVIINLRYTTIYNLSELIEIGIVVLKTDNVQEPLYTYTSYIKPSILQRLSSYTRKYEEVKWEDLTKDFSEILKEITTQEPLISHALQNGLIIVLNASTMGCHFARQCEIEQRFEKSFPSADAMKPFTQWCCLKDLDRVVREIALTSRGYAIDKWRNEIAKTYKYEDCRLSCVGNALALLPLIEMYIRVLDRQLFPTTIVNRSPDNIYASRPVIKSLHRYYKSPLPIDDECQSGRYVEGYDEDGGTDSDEEATVMGWSYNT